MRHRVDWSDQSKRDIVELADYISQNSYDASIRFMDAVEKTSNFLAVNREVGQLCHFENSVTQGLRVWPIEKFRNYLVFFWLTEDGIIIERVLHGARDFESLFGEQG